MTKKIGFAGGVATFVAVALYLGQWVTKSSDTEAILSQSPTQDSLQVSDVVQTEVAPAETAGFVPETITQPEEQTANQAAVEDQQLSPSEVVDSPPALLNVAISGFDPLLPSISAESRDENWSSEMEGQIMERISNFGLAATLVEVECRTTTCRFAMLLPEPLPDPNPLIGKEDNGNSSFVVGQELGLATNFIFSGRELDGSYVFRAYMIRFREDPTTQSIVTASTD